jgi:hypothetical protein
MRSPHGLLKRLRAFSELGWTQERRWFDLNYSFSKYFFCVQCVQQGIMGLAQIRPAEVLQVAKRNLLRIVCCTRAAADRYLTFTKGPEIWQDAPYGNIKQKQFLNVLRQGLMHCSKYLLFRGMTIHQFWVFELSNSAKYLDSHFWKGIYLARPVIVNQCTRPI